MKRRLLNSILLATACAAMLLAPAEIWAQKGKKSGGYSVVELPMEGYPTAINESTSGTVTVALDSAEEGYVSAAFVRVRASDRAILDHGFLPEPLFADPNDEVFKNGHSTPSDVNDLGTIVGGAAQYEDDPNYTGNDISPNRGIFWAWNGSAYTMEVLPTFNLTPTYAGGINNLGVIVGQSDERAVLWDPVTHEIQDLNTAGTAAAGWELIGATDINDAGQIIGWGFLLVDGEPTRRGFLLDTVTGAIWAVPLVGPADGNQANAINENGRVVGMAWNGEAKYYSTNPDYVQAYSWDGPGSDAVILPSVTNNTSHAFGLNDFGETTGNSYIPDDHWYLSDDAVPTHWALDLNGNAAATDLTVVIGGTSKWELLRAHDVNNDGWISVYGRQRKRGGGYDWRALLLIPNN